MLQKIKGIVLHTVKYQESGLIVYMYTNAHGRQTYIAKGVHKTKSKKKSNIFQPLFLLDLEVSHREGASMQSIRECKLTVPFNTIHLDVYKSTIALFISELLYKVIREEEFNSGLFDFLYHSIQLFDELENGVSNFHLHFMVQLSRYLGFLPAVNADENRYFDMKSGNYTLIKPMHPLYFDTISTQILSELQQVSASYIHQIKINHQDRYVFLDKMIDFYSFHFDRILSIHSLSVLHEVFS